MYELGTVRPAFPPDARFSVTESHAYGIGWYAALGRALQCLQLAEERFELAERQRRRDGKQKRSA